MLIPSYVVVLKMVFASLSRRVNANSQLRGHIGIANEQAYQEG